MHMLQRQHLLIIILLVLISNVGGNRFSVLSHLGEPLGFANPLRDCLTGAWALLEAGGIHAQHEESTQWKRHAK